MRDSLKHKSRGWVPVGYKYLGPGNDLYRGRPTTVGDKAAQKHDWKYEQLQQSGYKPYVSYVEEDDDFINEVGEKHVSEWIAKNIFKAKKRVAEAGWIPDLREKQKAKRETTPNDWTQFVKPRTKPKTTNFHNLSITNQFPAVPTSQTTSQQETMSNTGGSGNEHGLTETKIDKVNPYKVFRGPPNYTFASLPFQYDTVVYDLNTYARDHAFRMTSPYDPLNSIISSDINVGTGTQLYRGPAADVSDTVQRKANWFDYYAGLYKYYHTVSCEYSVFIENYGDPIWVYFMMINDEVPPGVASNTDMQLWDNCEYHYVNSPAYAHETNGVRTQGFIPKTDDTDGPMQNDEDSTPSGNNPADVETFQSGNMVATRSGQVTLQKYGQYTTGDYDNEIRLDADIENWTATNANPKLPEKLIIRVKPQSNALEGNSTRNAGDDLRYRLRVQINYLVEFKELDYKIRYPLVTQPITVTLNNSQNSRS